MKKTYIAAAGIGLMLAIIVTALPTIAGTEQSQIAKANAAIQGITGLCVASLHKADSRSQMDGIAQLCDYNVMQVLTALEAQLGHSVPYTTSVVCVTNNKVGYTACFDPIHIGGSGN